MSEQNETVNGMTLEEWTEAVDQIFYDKIGMGVYDILGDFSSYDMWHGEMTPLEAFEDLSGETIDTLECIANVGGMINPEAAEQLQEEFQDVKKVLS